MSLREKKIERKKQEIIESAISIIGEKGYHATTMEEIANNLLMTKGSIYYYFKDKQDLLYQSQVMILENSIENIQNIIDQDLPIKEKFHKMMYIHIEYLIRERTAFGIGTRPEQFFEGEQLESVLGLRKTYSKFLDLLIEQGIKEKEFVPIDVKIARNLVLGAMNWVVHWYSPDGEKDESELAKTMSDYLLKILL